MPYQKQSTNAVLGDFYESDVGGFFKARRWHVMHTAAIGDGATMVEGPNGNRVVMPDLQLFDLFHGRQSRLVEVKAKAGAYRYQKGQVDCTGVDRANWEHYLRINAGGVPVYLAIVHLRQPHRFSPEIAPMLLCQSVAELQRRDPMTFEHESFPSGGIVWAVQAFETLGNLPNPPEHILQAIGAMRANLRVWEYPPKLRRIREFPGQDALTL